MVLAVELEKAGLRLVSGGTDNHIVLVDLTENGLTGLDAQMVLESVGIVSNRNVIPFATQSARIAGGIRLGPAAITSRGMGQTEMKTIAAWIVKIISNPKDETILKQVKQEVSQMCTLFPVPGIDF
jgi:glycine hydroxymethyltransferase